MDRVEKGTPLPKGGTLRILPLPDGQTLALVVLPTDLVLLDSAFRQFEDITAQHRNLQQSLSAQGLTVRHALLTDDKLNAHLLDLVQEDVLLEVRGEDDLVERLLPHLGLTALARGSLSALARKALHQRARELHDWVRVWSHRIGAASRTSPTVAEQFFQGLLLARLSEELGLLPGRKLPFRHYGTGGAPSPVRYLLEVFRPLSRNWNLLQGIALDRAREVAKAADAAGELRPCLESFARLSRAKFFAEVLAEAFSDEGLRLVSWRRHLLAEPLQERPTPEDWLADPARLNLDECGFSVLLAQFDAVTEALRDLARQQTVACERGERPGLQMDLLGGGEPPELEEEDAPRLTMQQGLRVETSNQRRAGVARLVLLAHAVHWYARLRRPEPLFPTPPVVLHKEPSGSTKEPPAPAPPRPVDSALN